MRKWTTILTAAAVLPGPAMATAQVAGHSSIGIGLAVNQYPDYRYGTGIGLAASAHEGFQGGNHLSLGVGFGPGYDSHDYGYGDYYYDTYPFPLWPRHHCRDFFRFDPYHGCYPRYSHGWFNPWWEPVVVIGWPRVHFGWYSHSYRRDPYYDRWGYRGWDPYRYYDRGYAGTRVASRLPLFGPRYKEDPRPRVYVTDNGPERPVSRAVPRGDRAGQPAGVATSRPSARRPGTDARREPATRTARPRVRARPETGQTTSPRPTVGRTTPAVGRTTTVGTRPKAVPRVRSTPSRGTVPSTRSTPSRSAAPKVGPPTRARVRPAPPKIRPTSARARSAPARARSAPPRARSAPPKRPASKSPPRSSGAPRRRGK